MKIGFCGTVSVGKTTLVKELSKLDEFRGYKFETEKSKEIRDKGVEINTNSTILGQMIFTSYRAEELFNNNLIADRSIWDVCAFTLSTPLITDDSKNKLIESAMLIKDYYDIIIYVSPEGIEIEDNGLRATDPQYRIEIDNNIKWLLKSYPPQHLLEIKGTNEERINLIMQELKRLSYL